MSAILSNIYMLDFDRQMAALASSKAGLYRRYCDDIILVIPEEHAPGVVDAVEAAATEARVDLHPDKRHQVRFPGEASTKADDTLQYLGFIFDGERVLLRLSSLDRYYCKMRKGVSLARQTQRKHNREENAAGLPLSPLRLKKLYRLYSYLHKRRRKPEPDRDAKTIGNFLTYVYRAADKLDSQAIRNQVRAHWKKLREEIERPIKNQLRGP